MRSYMQRVEMNLGKTYVSKIRDIITKD